MQTEPLGAAGVALTALDDGWEMAAAAVGGVPQEWIPARVPGTAAGALLDAGLLDRTCDLDTFDYWFRKRFSCALPTAGEEVVLRLEGLATVADVHLNGDRILESESMFVAHELEVGSQLASENELLIHFHALAPLLAASRQPRARWRTKLAHGNLRFFRTMLLGRCPGVAPGPAPVGPWKPVLLERRHGIVVEQLSLRTRVEGDEGVLRVTARLRAIEGPLPEQVEVEVVGRRALLPVKRGRADGEVRVPDVELWWPHTHGEPLLHETTFRAAELEVSRRVGFRRLEPGPEYDVADAALGLRVNGVEIFARGVVWTPPDFIRLASDGFELREALEQVRACGMNIVRIPGTGAYQSETFHDLCDELGLLVWQDFMFANFDYPAENEDFRALVEKEARQVLEAIAGRPSLAVLCGNSEIEQQVAMLGLDPQIGRGELFGKLLPALAREADADVPYVPSAPSGGDLPFRPDRGVTNYYGVGGYRRPLEDARRARVGFAAECLAIANVPDDETLEATGLAGVAVHEPRWKAGVPRDAGSGWDFDDVRDWYLEHLFGVDPVELRRADLPRYLELSRAVSGEVMAEVFGEWRRRASPCSGGQVLWLRDLAPGPGWGLLDVTGRPKVAYHHLRRTLAPIAVWTTDEGLGGIDAHVANDRAEPLRACLRVTLYRDLEVRVDEASTEIELAPHDTTSVNVETVLGHFADVSWTYRFGPPSADLVIVSLEDREGRTLGQTVRFPVGRPLRPESVAALGLKATASANHDGQVSVEVHAQRFVYGARVSSPGWIPADDGFSVEPGKTQTVELHSTAGLPFLGKLTALNLDGPLRIPGASE